MFALAVLTVIIAMKTSAGQGISLLCFDDGYRNGGFTQIHIPHLSPVQRAVDEPRGYCFTDYMMVEVPVILIILPVLIVIIPVVMAVNVMSLSTKKQSD
jgi:hypothetical protein